MLSAQLGESEDSWQGMPKPKPHTEAAVDEIRDRILRGEISPGEPIVEREIAESSYTWKLWMRGREKKAAYPPETMKSESPVAAGGEGTPDVEGSG